MISGLNQEVDILGKTFHFQTELNDQDGLTVRTEVFLGGRVVATRESRPDAAERDEALIRSRMKQQHQRTLETFVKRARNYQQRGRKAPTPEAEAPAAAPEPAAPEPPAPEPPAPEPPEPPAPERPTGLRPPTVEETPKLANAIRIRRFFGRFRSLTGATVKPRCDLGECLETTSQALAWMIQSPLFSAIRIDEQARCHLLKGQTDEWLESERDPKQAALIWSGVMVFNNYLNEINHRSELVSFDQQMLVWAIDEIQRRGMAEDIFQHLMSLYGRHPQLDRLFDRPEGIPNGHWTAYLRSVLT